MSKEKKVKTPKELNPLKLWKKGKVILTDDVHVIGWGLFESIPKNLIKEHYGNICFNFDYLQSALDFFKSTHQDRHLIRCYMPKNGSGPVFFVTESNVMKRRKTEEVFYAIAPRLHEDLPIVKQKVGSVE